MPTNSKQQLISNIGGLFASMTKTSFGVLAIIIIKDTNKNVDIHIWHLRSKNM